MKTAQRNSFAHRVGLVLLVLGLLAQAVVPALAAPETFPTLGNVVISNLTDVGFTASWTSDIASDGAVVIQPPSVYAGSYPDANTIGTTTHYVQPWLGTEPGLSMDMIARSCDPLALPAFDCTDSPLQSVTLAPTINAGLGQDHNPSIEGTVTTSVGDPVPFAIVYLSFSLDGTCGTDVSALASTQADDLGRWAYNLADARKADVLALDYGFYFNLMDPTPEVAGSVCLKADGGALGVSQPPPVLLPPQTDGFTTLAPLVLSAPTAVSLSGLTATAGGSTLPVAFSAAGILGAAIGIMVVQLRKLTD